jgi:hypothetical protein
MVVTMGDVLSFRTGLSSDGAAVLAGKVATIVTNATDVSVVDDEVTITDHGFITGDKVTWTKGDVTISTNLTNLTGYYIIKVDTNTFSLATSAANAAAGTPIIVLTATGTGGTFTLTNYTVSESTRNPIGVAIHDVDAKETEQPLAVQLFTGGGILLMHVDGNLNGAIAVGDTVGVATDSHTGQKGGGCSLGIALEACGAAEDRLINVLV